MYACEVCTFVWIWVIPQATDVSDLRLFFSYKQQLHVRLTRQAFIAGDILCFLWN